MIEKEVVDNGKEDRNAGVLLHAKRYRQRRSTTTALREPDEGGEPWDKFEFPLSRH